MRGMDYGYDKINTASLKPQCLMSLILVTAEKGNPARQEFTVISLDIEVWNEKCIYQGLRTVHHVVSPRWDMWKDSPFYMNLQYPDTIKDETTGRNMNCKHMNTHKNLPDWFNNSDKLYEIFGYTLTAELYEKSESCKGEKFISKDSAWIFSQD